MKSDRKEKTEKKKQFSHSARQKLFMVILLLFCGIALSAGQESEDGGIMKTEIMLTLKDDKTIQFELSDNPASRDFLELLPVTLDFQDYNRTEKVSSLPTALSTAGSPSGYKPEIGDFCLYAPWGNLCIFYRDFAYASGLIKLGHVSFGREYLESIEGPVVIKKVP